MLHHTAEKLAKWLDDWKFEPTVVTTLWFIVLGILTWVYDPVALRAFGTALLLTSPIWLPVGIFFSLWVTWIEYIRYKFYFTDKKIVLEVQLPPEIEKSPLAMEVVLNGMWNNGRETTFMDRLWKGRFRSVWSFEIASNEGRINYYIHAPAGWKNFIESRIYGQYPEVSIREVPDYTSNLDNFNLEEYDCWVGEYKKRAEPQALPIKTYVDYELDKNPDTPETKIDPLTNTFELMNNIGKDQFLWVQFIVRARKKDEWYGIYKKGDSYLDPAKKAIVDIMAGAAKRAQDVLKASDVVEGKVNALLTDGEKKKIEAIENSIGKPIFECGIRVVYAAKKDKFYGLTGAPLFRFFEAYRSPFNEITGTRGLVQFDYPWEDFMGMRKRRVKMRQIFFYKQRAYFTVPYEQAPIFLTTQELASLWHFPGSAVKTPGLNRIPSKRAEAPSNLPITPA